MERVSLSLREKIKMLFTSLGRSVLGKTKIWTSWLANNRYIYMYSLGYVFLIDEQLF